MTFDEMRSAYKRAKHFSSIDFSGPFTPTGQNGAAIAARNYCLLIDAKDEADFLGDLCILHAWARSINRFCDQNRIKEDRISQDALSAFLSRLFINPLAS